MTISPHRIEPLQGYCRYDDDLGDSASGQCGSSAEEEYTWPGAITTSFTVSPVDSVNGNRRGITSGLVATLSK